MSEANSLAAVFSGDVGSIELRRIRTPVPRDSEILVRVESCTLCASDIHSYKGQRRVAVPTVLGHEIVGRIESFGPTAPRLDEFGQELTEGARIVWGIVASCGECFCCRRDLPQKCLRAVKYGHQAFREGYELLGGLAEHCLVVPHTTIIRVPESMSLETVTPCSCATATIAAAIETAGPLEGRNVLITGAGLLGLTAAAMVRASGAAEVIMSDIDSARLLRAIKFGATRCVLPHDIELVVGDSTRGYGVDLAIEVSGATSAFDSLWPHVRLGGSIALVGAVYPADSVSLSMEQIVRRNLAIHGIHNYGPRHLIRALKFLSEHAATYHLDRVVSRWFDLSDVQEAFRYAIHTDHIRIGVKP